MNETAVFIFSLQTFVIHKNFEQKMEISKREILEEATRSVFFVFFRSRVSGPGSCSVFLAAS